MEVDIDYRHVVDRNQTAAPKHRSPRLAPSCDFSALSPFAVLADSSLLPTFTGCFPRSVFGALL